MHRTAWVETYGDLLSSSFWETDTLERRTNAWQEWLERGDQITVAEAATGGATDEGGHPAGWQVVGFAMGGASRTIGEHAPVRDLELYALNVLASHHGSGVGQALLDAVIFPGSPAQLWVAEQNPRARRFYAKNGFVPDDATFVDERLEGLAELRMVR